MTGAATATRTRGALVRELVAFGAVGIASTVVHLGGFVLLRQALGSPQVANSVALLVAAVANTWANRRWTFGITGREGAVRHQVQGLLVFALTLGMTSGGLALLGALAPGSPTWLETGVVAVTTVAATAVKYVAMRWWVFVPQGILEDGVVRGEPVHPDVTCGVLEPHDDIGLVVLAGGAEDGGALTDAAGVRAGDPLTVERRGAHDLLEGGAGDEPVPHPDLPAETAPRAARVRR
ncbi:GtrA family protein [Phycicoccus sp. HDW14]|uniref:GtrA family protein n=1 Tax=Phycicoccus sp. HDW14 TaxID=2714941 RepID=UPI001408D0C5|nr:GtrA family protein [Phycicoccus sp. HDW14]QIM22148.1 GtrA family protein [Phycicoccus sp. HDW14]